MFSKLVGRPSSSEGGFHTGLEEELAPACLPGSLGAGKGVSGLAALTSRLGFWGSGLTQAGSRVQTGPVLSQTPSPKGGTLAQTAMSRGSACWVLGMCKVSEETCVAARAAAPVQGSLWGDSCLSLLLFLEPTARSGSRETQGPSESLPGDRHLLGELEGARVPSGPQPEPAFLGP